MGNAWLPVRRALAGTVVAAAALAGSVLAAPAAYADAAISVVGFASTRGPAKQAALAAFDVKATECTDTGGEVTDLVETPAVVRDADGRATGFSSTITATCTDPGDIPFDPTDPRWQGGMGTVFTEQECHDYGEEFLQSPWGTPWDDYACVLMSRMVSGCSGTTTPAESRPVVRRPLGIPHVQSIR